MPRPFAHSCNTFLTQTDFFYHKPARPPVPRTQVNECIPSTLPHLDNYAFSNWWIVVVSLDRFVHQ